MNCACPPSRWGGTTSWRASWTRCTPGGREDVALVDVQHARIDPHVRVLPSEIVTFRPVCGGPSALEQAGLGQHEGAGAERNDAAPSCMRSPQGLEDLRWHFIEPVGRGDHNGGDPACSLKPEWRLDSQPAVGRHGGTARTTDGEPVPRDAEVRQIAAPEDVTGDPELEHPHAVIDNDRHASGGPRRPLGRPAGSGAVPAGHRVGRKVAHWVNHATFETRRWSAPWRDDDTACAPKPCGPVLRAVGIRRADRSDPHHRAVRAPA